MEILLDSVHVEKIQKAIKIYNIAGVTTNPSLLARGGGGFFSCLGAIQECIGQRQLHIQVTARGEEEMVQESRRILEVFGMETYIKIPANETGIRVMKILKRAGVRVTATAVYTPQQAFLAASVGADYVAPYYNRMANNNLDPGKCIREIHSLFQNMIRPPKILGAGFCSTRQVVDALLAGAQAVTLAPELLTMMTEGPLIQSALDRFASDWAACFGEKRIFELEE